MEQFKASIRLEYKASPCYALEASGQFSVLFRMIWSRRPDLLNRLGNAYHHPNCR